MTSFTSRYGNPAVDYKGAHVRAHFRHVATVAAISGRIDASNVDHLTNSVARFVLADQPFILDLSGVESFSPQALRLLFALDDRCSAVGVDWAVVASEAVKRRLRIRNNDVLFPVVGSLAEAEHEFDDAILNRRRFLLPLLSKTA
ncbi:anti-sigma factor antagonist [Mycolicibacterium anyangense]|uniref:Anti-sigma factor antagonist n=1 Tax=Mycolicibacterium anyangense TaxID=1431246 RepID=A0A6N4W7E7_9MYCO|nr:STAS domain-containing protein [Mycolicibacterium anyangense]BBZ76047.1 anti-sigma factor antagonist [Mycolicibacterium anyangense]